MRQNPTHSDVCTTAAAGRDMAPPRMLAAAAGSWAVDALMLGLLTWGAGVPAQAAFWTVAIGGALSAAGFGLAFALRWNRHSRDRYLTLPQLFGASCVALVAAAQSPAVAMPMAAVLFIVFAFAALRMTRRQLLFAWAVITVGLAAVIPAAPTPPALPADTPLQAALSTIWLSLSLGRCALLGLYGAGLRRQLAQRGRELAVVTGRMERLAMRDALTGALNRRAIMEALDGALDAADPQAGPLAVALVDLDHFKGINDRFGHPVGDDVLRRFVTVAARSLRVSDRIGRWGGEEFLVVLPASGGVEAARMVAERLREAVATHPWSEFGAELAVTVSVGVALARPGMTQGELLGRADLSLYRAKRAGRDRVCVDGGDARGETDSTAHPGSGTQAA
ncbi:MAG: GGDEF domain-containing protein [Burkholderiales bacterium]|nr:GGDEF domain-containing protein [Burkholderiales bacterium]